MECKTNKQTNKKTRLDHIGPFKRPQGGPPSAGHSSKSHERVAQRHALPHRHSQSSGQSQGQSWKAARKSVSFKDGAVKPKMERISLWNRTWRIRVGGVEGAFWFRWMGQGRQFEAFSMFWSVGGSGDEVQ